MSAVNNRAQSEPGHEDYERREEMTFKHVISLFWLYFEGVDSKYDLRRLWVSKIRFSAPAVYSSRPAWYFCAMNKLSDQGAGADEQELGKLGYAQELFRTMGGFSNFAISFSIISILTGAVTLYGHGLKMGGP